MQVFCLRDLKRQRANLLRKQASEDLFANFSTYEKIKHIKS